jgi:hypothetical protein
MYGRYAVTNQNAFGSAANGYGFWVLGDSNVVNRKMVFTNAPSGGKHLYEPGGIRVVRPHGSYADAVCYGAGSLANLTNAGFRYIGRETSSFASSSLFQTGTVGALYWTYLTSGLHFTPGQANENEWFPSPLSIVTYWWNTNVWIECTTSNALVPAPWYSTNLLDTNGWTNVASFWSSYPTFSTNGTFFLHFIPPTNTPVFFRVAATNGL